MTSRTFTEEKTPAIAEIIADNLKGGDILAIFGNLATGKTTLTRAVAQKMGYTGPVLSPTFVLERHYPINFRGAHEIIHLDFYRLDDKSISTFDWQDYLHYHQKIIIIEWPERIRHNLPPGTKKIVLEIINEKTRKITFDDSFKH